MSRRDVVVLSCERTCSRYWGISAYTELLLVVGVLGRSFVRFHCEFTVGVAYLSGYLVPICIDLHLLLILALQGRLAMHILRPVQF
jgi:hypothetical protein